jgi:hypothetical protein
MDRQSRLGVFHGVAVELEQERRATGPADHGQAVTERAGVPQPPHADSGVLLERRHVLALDVVEAGPVGIGEYLDRLLVQRDDVPERAAGPPDKPHGLQPQRAVPPSGRMVGQHLRGDAQDRHVEQIVEQGSQLAAAGQVGLDQLDAGAGGGVSIGDHPAGRQLEDVGYPHDIGLRLLLHPLGEGEQVPCVVEEPPTARGEADMTAVAQQQRRAQLVLKLADLLGERRLADVEPRGGPAEMQLVGHRDEIAQQPQV